MAALRSWDRKRSGAAVLEVDDATRMVLADIGAEARAELADLGRDLYRPRHPLETVEEREQDRDRIRAGADRLLDAISAERLVPAVVMP